MLNSKKSNFFPPATQNNKQPDLLSLITEEFVESIQKIFDRREIPLQNSNRAGIKADSTNTSMPQWDEIISSLDNFLAQIPFTEFNKLNKENQKHLKLLITHFYFARTRSNWGIQEYFDKDDQFINQKLIILWDINLPYLSDAFLNLTPHNKQDILRLKDIQTRIKNGCKERRIELTKILLSHMDVFSLHALISHTAISQPNLIEIFKESINLENILITKFLWEKLSLEQKYDFWSSTDNFQSFVELAKEFDENKQEIFDFMQQKLVDSFEQKQISRQTVFVILDACANIEEEYTEDDIPERLNICANLELSLILKILWKDLTPDERKITFQFIKNNIVKYHQLSASLVEIIDPASYEEGKNVIEFSQNCLEQLQLIIKDSNHGNRQDMQKSFESFNFSIWKKQLKLQALSKNNHIQESLVTYN